MSYQKLTLDSKNLDSFSVKGHQVVGLLVNFILTYANEFNLEIAQMICENDKRIHVIFKLEDGQTLPQIPAEMNDHVVFQTEEEKHVLADED